MASLTIYEDAMPGYGRIYWTARAGRSFVVDHAIDDAMQAVAVGYLQADDHQGRIRRARAALDRLARDLGWARLLRRDGSRVWCRPKLSEMWYRAGYLRDSDAHCLARMKVAPERRREIARLGAAARAAKKETKC